ncbi:MAG: hypothetical protein GC160_06830 [Acidobacteria bacterium]|nr:hypothetical protein [Acidobacteriota bacterium]
MNRLIRLGRPLLLAGSEEALSQLDRGDWIGGTISYFMTPDGGRRSDAEVYVAELPADAVTCEARLYECSDLPSVCQNTPYDGYTLLILPFGGETHQRFALGAPAYKDCFVSPVVGWVAGVPLESIGTRRAKVFLGREGRSSEDAAVAMHVVLPPEKAAEIDIFNIFRPGDGPAIRFPETGFSAKTAFVDEVETSFAEYYRAHGRSGAAPLTADYCGTIVNVSIQCVDEASGEVQFYAPVFEKAVYRFAKPVADYSSTFADALRGEHADAGAFCCNCILNYLFGKLEAKHTGQLTGPMTFGEIAHQVLNQTLVRLRIVDRRQPG